MFTVEDIKQARRIAAGVTVKSATTVPGYTGNPRVFNQAWNLHHRPAIRMSSRPQLGFGDHVKNVFTGTGKQLGHYGQALISGHNGHNSVLENVIKHPIQNTLRFVNDPKYRQSVSLSDIPKSLWKDVSKPFEFARPQLQQAYSETGGLGGYMMGKVQEPYYTLKNYFGKPVDY